MLAHHQYIVFFTAFLFLIGIDTNAKESSDEANSTESGIVSEVLDNNVDSEEAIEGEANINSVNNVAGIDRNYEVLLQKAKEGIPEAQYAIAKCYATGQGVEENIVFAYTWFRIAAMLGYSDGSKIGQIVGNLLTDEEHESAERAAISWVERRNNGEIIDLETILPAKAQTRLVLYRPSLFVQGGSYPNVYINGIKSGTMKNGTYNPFIIDNLNTTNVLLRGMWWTGRTALDINPERGRAYYLRFVPSASFNPLTFIAPVSMIKIHRDYQTIDAASALKEIENLGIKGSVSRKSFVEGTNISTQNKNPHTRAIGERIAGLGLLGIGITSATLSVPLGRLLAIEEKEQPVITGALLVTGVAELAAGGILSIIARRKYKNWQHWEDENKGEKTSMHFKPVFSITGKSAYIGLTISGR